MMLLLSFMDLGYVTWLEVDVLCWSVMSGSD